MPRTWVGVDIGKEHHWAVALDADGATLLSRKVTNDETAILELLAAVSELAEEASWAVDLTTAESALLLSLLWSHSQPVRYLPGRAVNRAAAGYRSEGKTDAKDARVIADQARMRRDLVQLQPAAEQIVELRMLTTRRADLVADRTRAINRLRQQLIAICPALERAADFTSQRGWLVLLSRYQRPQAIRRTGVQRLTRVLAGEGIRNAAAVAEQAVQAARAQTSRLPGEDIAADLVADSAKEVMGLNTRIKDLDTAIEALFHRHRLAEVILSLPGMGFRLGAEFLAAVGDLSWFASPDHLAAYAGLVPVPNDSGKRTGRLHRPQRYNRRLRRVFYLAALTAIRYCPISRAYYERKRAEGKTATQAIIALARRRLNVLWALMRDNRTWQPQPPANTTIAA